MMHKVVKRKEKKLTSDEEKDAEEALNEVREGKAPLFDKAEEAIDYLKS